MSRNAVLFVLALWPTAALSAQDGQPLPRPVVIRTAWVYNNTKEPISWSCTSGSGCAHGVVNPGRFGKISFLDNGGQRVLTVFSTKTGELISCRSPTLQDGYYYNASFKPKVVTVQKEIQVPDGKGGFRTDIVTEQVLVPEEGTEGTPDPKQVDP